MFLRVLDNEARNARPRTDRKAAFNASHLEIRMFHVGHGEAVLVIFERTRAWLFDCGCGNHPKKNKILGNEIVAYMEGRGLVLEAIVPSHPHIDHAGAFETILTSGSAAVAQSVTIYRSEDASWHVDNECKPAWLCRFHSAIRANDVQIALPSSHHEVFIAPNISAHLFSGTGDGPYTSVFVQLRYHGARILFTGDAECSYELELLGRFGVTDFDADIFKVTHHGSSSGTAARVVAASKPGIAIVSTGDDSGHRLEFDTLQRLGGHIGARPPASIGVRPVFETVMHGDIILRTDGQPYIGGILYELELDAPGQFKDALKTEILAEADIDQDDNPGNHCV